MLNKLPTKKHVQVDEQSSRWPVLLSDVVMGTASLITSLQLDLHVSDGLVLSWQRELELDSKSKRRALSYVSLIVRCMSNT